MTVGVGQAPVAREAELDLVRGFASFAEAGAPHALLLEGEAGIGKTTLWRAGVDAAMLAGVGTRTTTAAESEASFAFAPLADLLRPLPDAVLDAVPAPQREALEGALLLAGSGGGAVSLHAVAAGFLSALRALGGGRPLLVALDDVQWLDRASAQVLSFAARRAANDPIRFLLARRPADDAERVLDPGPEVLRLELAPLSFGALQRLLLRRGTVLSGLALRRIHESSGGNPYFAIELADALARRGGDAPAHLDVLSVPETLVGLLDERVARLPADAERAVLAVALLADATAAAVTAALGDGAGLDAAEAAGFVVREHGRVRLSHPLLGTAARSRATAPDLRRLHLRLADAVGSAEERARHLALGSEPPDDEVAAVLERAAAAAGARGAAAAAAELAREAFLFSDPAGSERRRGRLLDACARHLRAGLFSAGSALLAPELDAFPPGPERARARFLQLILARDSRPSMWEEALAEAEGIVRAEILAELSFMTATELGRLAQAHEWAEEAVALAVAAGDEELERRAAQSVALIAALRGDPGPARDLAAAGSVDVDLSNSPERLLALVALWRGEVPEARRLLDELHSAARERDEEWNVATALLHRFELEARVGDLGALERAGTEFERAIAPFATLAEPAAGLRRLRALLAALAGDVETARRAADASGELGWHGLEAVRARGLAALLAGDGAAAATALLTVRARLREAGVRAPGAFPVGGDLAEALAATGRLDEALQAADELAATAAELSHPWATAVAARARGIVLDARGEHAAAEASLREALALHERLELPLDEARALLALGSLLRRARRLREARVALEDAAARFEALGVRPLAERARDELARVSGRRTGAGLTPTEARVAELVAAGGTNREVAAALVVTPKSVERHLTRIYAKLGVRTRADLARLAGETVGNPLLPREPSEP